MTRNGQPDLAVLFSQTAASDLTVEHLLEEELFVILPAASPLVARERESLPLREVVALPLILPSPGHGLRRRIALEFERINLPLDVVAEIDSLPLLMSCVAEGLGATIKPMAAIHSLGDTPQRWRCLRISDASRTRPNYLYALPPQKLSPCAAVVRDELRRVVRQLVETGHWQGVSLGAPKPDAAAVDGQIDMTELAVGSGSQRRSFGGLGGGAHRLRPLRRGAPRRRRTPAPGRA